MWTTGQHGVCENGCLQCIKQGSESSIDLVAVRKLVLRSVLLITNNQVVLFCCFQIACAVLLSLSLPHLPNRTTATCSNGSLQRAVSESKCLRSWCKSCFHFLQCVIFVFFNAPPVLLHGPLRGQSQPAYLHRGWLVEGKASVCDRQSIECYLESSTGLADQKASPSSRAPTKTRWTSFPEAPPSAPSNSSAPPCSPPSLPRPAPPPTTTALTARGLRWPQLCTLHH